MKKILLDKKEPVAVLTTVDSHHPYRERLRAKTSNSSPSSLAPSSCSAKRRLSIHTSIQIISIWLAFNYYERWRGKGQHQSISVLAHPPLVFLSIETTCDIVSRLLQVFLSSWKCSNLKNMTSYLSLVWPILAS